MNSVYVVSGSPRSGTSMVMQMLYIAGFDLLVDDKRKADRHNPKGYFEYEPVKNTATNNYWVDEAIGKAVKVVDYILPSLPIGDYKYKIIYMERNLREVLSSQNKMLKTKQYVSSETLELLKSLKLEVIRKIKEREDFEIRYINYKWFFKNPRGSVTSILTLFDREADESTVMKMISTIDKDLYRNRY